MRLHLSFVSFILFCFVSFRRDYKFPGSLRNTSCCCYEHTFRTILPTFPQKNWKESCSNGLGHCWRPLHVVWLHWWVRWCHPKWLTEAFRNMFLNFIHSSRQVSGKPKFMYISCIVKYESSSFPWKTCFVCYQLLAAIASCKIACYLHWFWFSLRLTLRETMEHCWAALLWGLWFWVAPAWASVVGWVSPNWGQGDFCSRRVLIVKRKSSGTQRNGQRPQAGTTGTLPGAPFFFEVWQRSFLLRMKMIS